MCGHVKGANFANFVVRSIHVRQNMGLFFFPPKTELYDGTFHPNRPCLIPERNDISRRV